MQFELLLTPPSAPLWTGAPSTAPLGPASVSWAPEDVHVTSSVAAARELSAARAQHSSTLELLDPRAR